MRTVVDAGRPDSETLAKTTLVDFTHFVVDLVNLVLILRVLKSYIGKHTAAWMLEWKVLLVLKVYKFVFLLLIKCVFISLCYYQ